MGQVPAVPIWFLIVFLLQTVLDHVNVFKSTRQVNFSLLVFATGE